MDNQYGHTLAYRSSNGETVVFTAPEDTQLPQLLRLLERYIRSSGFVFNETATLDIIEEDAR
jgi:hypothetical protein